MGVMQDRRIVVFVGHYGSGKTECAVNYVYALRKETDRKIAIADLDIANPYFLSREKKEEMEKLGIENLSTMVGMVVTDAVPALDPQIRRPLENPEYRCIVDAGGDPSGAKMLVQFEDFLHGDDVDIFGVVNANRPLSATAEKAYPILREIEDYSHLKITGIVNNTHLLLQTSLEDILKGNRVAKETADMLGVPLVYNTCIETLVPELEKYRDENGLEGEIFPIRINMRDSYLDIQL